MTKLSLAAALAAMHVSTVTCVQDTSEMNKEQYQELLSKVSVKFHLIDYHEQVEAMHVLVIHDEAESMYSVCFVHIAVDQSYYTLTVTEVTSSLVDAISAMSEQLIIDFHEYDNN